MKNTMNFKINALILLGLATIFISSCSTLSGVMQERVKKPEVEFLDARLDKISFDSIGLMFDLKVRNPNSVGLKLAGFSYEFLINGVSFVNGNQERNIDIEARGESPIQFPVSFGFLNLYETFQSLRDQDVSNYQINFGFSFNVPVLGVVTIPVSKSGDFPLLKIPKLSIESLRLRNLSLTGADLRLGVKLNNPNAFSMLLDKLHYDFEVNGLQWISGESIEASQVPEKGEGLIEIPIRLNLIELGRSVYQLLNSNNDLNYQFGGDININTSLPLLGKVNLPFDHSGKIKVTR
jgi:LEA14-like dessication related protein